VEKRMLPDEVHVSVKFWDVAPKPPETTQPSAACPQPNRARVTSDEWRVATT
jgi:hypothetical protein